MHLALALLIVLSGQKYVAPHRNIPVPPPGTVGVVRSAFGETRLDRGTTYGTFAADDAERQRVPATVSSPTPEPAPSPTIPPVQPGEAALPDQPENLVPDTALETLIRNHIATLKGLDAAVVLYDLHGFRKVEIAPRDEIYPGSLVRLPILATAAELMARGTLPANRLVQLPPKALPVAELARQVGTGNLSAANALLDLVTPDAIRATCRSLGLAETAVQRGFNRPKRQAPPNTMPPTDAARLLYRLARADLPPAVPGLLRDLLPRPRAGARLGAAAGLPGSPEMTIAGLTGDATMTDLSEVKTDAALIQSSTHRYVLVVYTRHDGDAAPWITALALAIHDALRP